MIQNPINPAENTISADNLNLSRATADPPDSATAVPSARPQTAPSTEPIPSAPPLSPVAAPLRTTVAPESTVSTGPVPDGPTLPATAPLVAPAADPRSAPILISSVFGTVETLSLEQRARFMACEDVVETGWGTYVQVGLALATIRNEELYRGQSYLDFEDYCRKRWQYGLRYANQLIAAAEVQCQLKTSGSAELPEHEAQIRPLTGLTGEQVKAAWNRAVEIARGRRITAARVKAAVRELKFEQPKTPEKQTEIRMKGQRQHLVRECLSELLTLIKERKDYQTLLEKAQILEFRFESLTSRGKRKK